MRLEPGQGLRPGGLGRLLVVGGAVISVEPVRGAGERPRSAPSVPILPRARGGFLHIRLPDAVIGAAIEPEQRTFQAGGQIQRRCAAGSGRWGWRPGHRTRPLPSDTGIVLGVEPGIPAAPAKSHDAQLARVSAMPWARCPGHGTWRRDPPAWCASGAFRMTFCTISCGSVIFERSPTRAYSSGAMAIYPSLASRRHTSLMYS